MSALRRLIVSPQAGLGNRLRTIASALVLGKQLNRRVFHCWTPMNPTDARPWVAALQEAGFHGLFQSASDLPELPPDQLPHIPLCYSEWLPGSYWYYFQSNAQQACGSDMRVIQSSNPADDIALKSGIETILVETGLAIRLSPELGGCRSDLEWETELSWAYSLLTPQNKFLSLLEPFAMSDIGIAIRRGDLLDYFAEANQDLSQLTKWVLDLSKDKTTMIFSDDDQTRRELSGEVVQQERAGQLVTSHDGVAYADKMAQYEKAIEGRSPLESAMFQFLYLALKCRVVCGTPASSFAKEAALFGNRPFFYNLSQITI